MKDLNHYIITTTDGVFTGYRVVEEEEEIVDSLDEEDYTANISEQFYNDEDGELICAFHVGTNHDGVDIKSEDEVSLEDAQRLFSESGSNVGIYKRKIKEYVARK